MGAFSIRVVNSDGNPKSGIRVTVDYGLFSGQDTKYTASNGWVSFNNLDGDLTHGEVYIDGVSQGTVRTHSGDSHSFTL